MNSIERFILMSKRKIGGSIFEIVRLTFPKSSTLKFQLFMDFGGQDVDPGPAGIQDVHGSGAHFCDFGV